MKNGIATAALSEMTAEIATQPAQGCVAYGVALNWRSGTRAEVEALPEFACRAYVDQQSIVLVDLPNPVVDPVSWVERRGAVLPARFHMIQAAMVAPSHPDGTFHPHPPIPPRTARKRRQP